MRSSVKEQSGSCARPGDRSRRLPVSLGVNEGTPTTWVARDRAQRDGAAGDRVSESEREELLRLRRENAELAMEQCSSDQWSCG
jgi:transposase-like protein